MKYKYSFQNDYSEGAHPNILALLNKTNLEQDLGYGLDSYCNKAADFIKVKIKNPNATIHFVTSGSLANVISLTSMLRPYESVISSSVAHINVHETGALEGTGHKINTIQSIDGKITPEQIIEMLEQHQDEHMVKPKVVAITNSTELGTVYKMQEIKNIASVCKENNLYLYLDGARLGSALTSPASDITLPELSEFLDIFYIGGTKNGALLGEAIVINNTQLQENFRYHIKHRSALLAKGRVLGIQFVELFKDDLFFTLAKHANSMASKLTDGITKLGYKMLTNSPTNQIFPILPNNIIEKLNAMYGFYSWVKINSDSTAIRLVTSWATREEAIDDFLSDLKSLS